MTPRQAKPSATRRLRAAGTVLVLVASLAASGCSLLPSSNDSNDSNDPATTAATSASAAAPKAKADAKPTQPPTAGEALADKVKASLTALGNNTSSPNREQMMTAMLDAGAVKEKVEISIDRTPTGLAVDAIEAAAPVAKECVIGQVRDGKAAVTILPLLASGRCFVGDQH